MAEYQQALALIARLDECMRMYEECTVNPASRGEQWDESKMLERMRDLSEQLETAIPTK